MGPAVYNKRTFIPTHNNERWVMSHFISGISKELTFEGSTPDAKYTLLPRLASPFQLYWVNVDISADFSSSGDITKNWLNVFTIPDDTALKFFAREQAGTFNASNLFQPEISFNLNLGTTDNFQAIASGWLIEIKQL